MNKKMAIGNNPFITYTILILIPVFLVSTFYCQYRTDKELNASRCKTKELEIKGTVTAIYGHASQAIIMINNLKGSISFDLDKELYRKGFHENRLLLIGDSITKKPTQMRL